MELSLRKARKLESKILTAIDQIAVPTEVEVRAKSSTFSTERYTAYEKLRSNMSVRTELSEARFLIRNLISEANHKVGINALMADRERLLAQLALVRTLESAPTATNEEVEDLVYATRTQLERGEVQYRLKVTATVPVFTTENLDKLKASIAATRQRVEEIEDELTQKNAGTKVKLSDSLVTLLKRYSLV
jgi:hypothetical protein